jgi:hypothetical protein
MAASPFLASTLWSPVAAELGFVDFPASTARATVLAKENANKPAKSSIERRIEVIAASLSKLGCPLFSCGAVLRNVEAGSCRELLFWDLQSSHSLRLIGQLRMPTLPFKLNQDRRHHIPRQQHKVTNWPAYEAGLRQRGSLTVWFTDEELGTQVEL